MHKQELFLENICLHCALVVSKKNCPYKELLWDQCISYFNKFNRMCDFNIEYNYILFKYVVNVTKIPI